MTSWRDGINKAQLVMGDAQLKAELGDYGLKFLHAEPTISERKAKFMVKLYFEVLGTTAKGVKQGAVLTHAVFKESDYFFAELIAFAAALLGEDPTDDSVYWENKLSSVIREDGSDKPAAYEGRNVAATVIEKPNQKHKPDDPKSPKFWHNVKFFQAG